MGQHEHSQERAERGGGGWKRALLIVGKAALVLNLLDLTTSIPSAYNTAVGARSTVGLVVQLVFAVVAIVWIARALPGWLRALNRAPIPRGPRYVIGVVLAAQLVYVFFKIERYPLTNVGMFTYKIEPWAKVTYVHSGYVQEFDGERRPFSIRRTGDPFLAEGIVTDWEMALMLLKYPRHKKVQQELARRADEVGEPRPELADFRLRFDADGVHIEKIVTHRERRQRARDQKLAKKLAKKRAEQRRKRATERARQRQGDRRNAATGARAKLGPVREAPRGAATEAPSETTAATPKTAAGEGR